MTPKIETLLKNLFESQHVAVLSTHRGGQPYASIVAFAALPGLQRICFATPRTTRKYANLTDDPRAAMLVDSRSNTAGDIYQAVAATAVGAVKTPSPEERPRLEAVYLAKHPHLAGFVKAPTVALMTLDVQTYYLVERFQTVTEVHVKPCV